jgi:Tfp pilus assembly protein PilV
MCIPATVHVSSCPPQSGHRRLGRSRALNRLPAPSTRLRSTDELARAHRHTRPGSDAGFALIEVIVSALLLGIITIGALSGFDSLGRASADERAHAQATVLVQQDEERLRELTTTQIAQLGTAIRTEASNGVCVEKPSTAWRYCEGTAFSLQPYTGTVFTITSSASYVSAEKSTLTCATAGGKADYLQTTSSARWPVLGSRPDVRQSSIVSTPTSAALMVKVTNQVNQPVAGANVTVTGGSNNVTQTTGAGGCVIIGALSPATVTVAVSKANWVNNNGKSPTKETTVSAGTLAAAEFTIGEQGSLTAEFESNGVSTEAIQSDAFYATQTGISAPSAFVGGVAGTFKHAIELTGLFPFQQAGEPVKQDPYTVFAGDCEANNPAVVTAGGEKLKGRTAQIEPGGLTKVKVEAPPVNLTIYEGTAGTKEKLIAKAASAKITNSECSKAAAQNLTTVPYQHYVTVNAAGELQPKYQPYAKALELCVVWLSPAKTPTYYTYKSQAPFANNKKTGTAAMVLYMKNGTAGYTKSGEYTPC